MVVLEAILVVFILTFSKNSIQSDLKSKKALKNDTSSLFYRIEKITK